MEEDDVDFTPSQSTSSNLASLFGFTKKPLPGNSSLTYTPPKAPKKEPSPSKKQPNEEKSNKGKILSSKAVFAHKLQDKSYVNQGLAGVVITGNHDSKIYEIILYKPTKEHLCKAKITRNFNFVSPSTYASFYDNNTQNWSIMFQSLADVEEFAEMVAICKFFSPSESSESIVIQDLSSSANSQVDSFSTVEITYNSKRLSIEGASLIKEGVKDRIKLSDSDCTPLNKALSDCSVNCKRVVIAPRSLSGRWYNELGVNQDLILVVKVEKIVSEPEGLLSDSKLVDDGAESPIDSSAEESTIKARGVSIKEALSSTKTQKANLISRMARMGQATLPLKKGVAEGPSDSEEEISVISSPKPRVSRTKVSGNNSQQNTSISQNPEMKQISVYQNEVPWQQSQLAKPGVIYQQLVPVSASPVSSPTTDPNLSVYVSESRIQAAELRMGISKVSEKVDLVLNKMQNLNVNEYKAPQSALMDGSGILSSIQSLITENEILKGKVEEQKGKIEQQNDRIFQLLELNHKYLEQNSTSHDKQSENEFKLKNQMELLQKKESEMEANIQKSLAKVKILQEELSTTESSKKDLEEQIDALQTELDKCRKNMEVNDEAKKKEMETFEEKMAKTAEINSKLEEKLKETLSENDKLKSLVKSQAEEIDAGKSEMKEWEGKKKKYEKMTKYLMKKISIAENKTETEMDDQSAIVEKLEEEKKSLLVGIKEATAEKEEEFKKMVDQLHKLLQSRFTDSEYSSEVIRSTINQCFKETVSGYFQEKQFTEKQQLLENPKEEIIPVPTARTSIQNIEVERKNVDGMEKTPEVNETSPSLSKDEEKETKSEEKKDDNGNRHKSYDQGWRTTKPPPPPLFDDEDDDDDWLS